MCEAEFCCDEGQWLADQDQYEREKKANGDSLVRSMQKRIEGQREELRRLNNHIRIVEQSRNTWKDKAAMLGKQLHNVLTAKPPEWISVEERLPEDGENVLIWVGKVESASIEKGISEDEREKMKNGELEDPIEYGWSKIDGLKAYKRSQAYRGCDVFGNNLVPYCWTSTSGHMEWFGQEATHWMPLPMPPKGDEGK